MTDLTREQAGPCPNCGKPIETWQTYRAGYAPHNFRTIPPTFDRGEYCDHITALQSSGAISFKEE